MAIESIYTDPDLALMTVTLMRPSVSGSVWDMAREEGLPVRFPILADGKLRFFARLSQEPRWKSRLDRLVSDGFLKEFQLDEFLVPIFVSGSHDDSISVDVLQKVTEILAHCGILVTMGAAGSNELAVAVPRTHVDDGLDALKSRLLTT